MSPGAGSATPVTGSTLLFPAGLLTNGDYLTFCTAAGTGGSFWRGQALTRWRPDPTADHQGIFFYLRDRERATVRSLTRRPAGGVAEREQARWRDGVIALERLADGIEILIEICISPVAPLELRRVTLRNLSGRRRRLEIASYLEVVLQRAEDDSAHPAYSKLFVETALESELQVLVARRRPRHGGECHPWLAQAFLGDGALEFDTDRARLLGRGRFDRPPAALASDAPLAGTVGNVLDPAFCQRRRFELGPGESATFTLVLGAGEDKEELLEAMRELSGPDFVETLFIATATREAGVLSAENRTALEALSVREQEPGPRPAEWPLPDVDGEEPESIDVGPAPSRSAPPEPGEEALEDWNGQGGFAWGGAEYAIRIGRGEDGALVLPPQPWVNVIADREFGFLVSETGSITTWSRNSRQHRLTPWSNDPVLDPHGEAFYLRDDETGEFWSALPGPAPGPGTYETRHGLGYSRFAYADERLTHEMWLFAPADQSAQVGLLTITNRGPGERTLSLYSYRRLVLGSLSESASRNVTTERDAETGGLLARNPLAGEFADGVTFGSLRRIEKDGSSTSSTAHSFTCDRADFLGMGGSMRAPAALTRGSLGGQVGDELDPCLAERVRFTLMAGESATCVALLGEARSLEAARAILRRYREPGAAETARREAVARWEELLSAVEVRTPSPALDRMVNEWAPYQTLACRLWGRTAFYQSGGAFGFRDQLQDAAGLVMWDPGLLRAQILLHAAHQFVEGDVLHWWHPPGGRGLRTRFADDLVWLAWATAYYIQTTGDDSVLAERARFLTARPLESQEDEAYLAPEDSGESGDLYEHCARALDRAMTKGAHGLPLFGSGDWNDGMNRVGREGRGESVWMGFFLYAVLDDFLPFCEARGDAVRVVRYRDYRDSVQVAIERDGWDGEWYRRAYYDDGTPLGSRDSDECQIDALVQAWAVLSRAAPPERARRAMAAVEERLISERDGLIRLLTPPFENTPQDPGYIKGYVPGVRENGGQYTHAALWVVRAMAELRRRDRAAPLLEMLSPVTHARTPEDVTRYRVEPYVIAADVYGEPPHVGRGGWTWYTGSAGWMLRVALESVLGIRIREGCRLEVRPCVPDDWPQYRVSYRLPGETTRYEILVRNPKRHAGEVRDILLDGDRVGPVEGAASVVLAHDGRTHTLEIVLE